MCIRDSESTLPDSYKMTALKMILCGEIAKSVEHREKEFKTYEELRAVVMTWAINQKIQNDRTQNDPMDLSHVPWDSMTANWGTQEEWGLNNQPPNNSPTTETPTDLNYMKAKGGGKGDSKGGKGPGNALNPAQYYMMMAMKAMKAGG